MDKTQITNRLSAALTLVDVADFVKGLSEGRLFAEDFLAILHDRVDPVVTFRAAWVLDHYSLHYPENFQPYLPQVVEALPFARHGGTQRSLSKILLLYTQKTIPKHIQDAAWAPIQTEFMVESLFTWLIDPKTPVAVQVNCMDVLYYFRHAYPWVAEELALQTTHLLQNGSAAMQSRGKKILKRLQKENRLA